MDKAEDAILHFLAELLTAWPDWLGKAVAAMRQQIEEVSQRVPAELAEDEKSYRKVMSRIENLVNALADGSLQSTAVRDRLDEAEAEGRELSKRIEGALKLLSEPVQMPDDEWTKQQLDDLAFAIREGGYESSLLLRQVIGRIEADQVISPGKDRGYARLRFRINGWETLKAILIDVDSGCNLDRLMVNCGIDTWSDEFVIDLGGPTKMDEWAPRIAQMREDGIKWKEIVEITGLDLNRAYRTWKRYVDAQNQAIEGDGDSDSKPSESDDPTPEDCAEMGDAA